MKNNNHLSYQYIHFDFDSFFVAVNSNKTFHCMPKITGSNDLNTEFEIYFMKLFMFEFICFKPMVVHVQYHQIQLINEIN